MAKAHIYLAAGANVEATDTFASWIDTTNALVFDMGTVVLTSVTQPQPNVTVGGYTTGNAHLEGIFSANTVVVSNGLRGGSTSTGGDLIVVSNTIFSESPLVRISANTDNFTVNSNNTTFTSNVAIDSTKTVLISAANTTINAGQLFVRTSSEFTGARVDIDGTTFDVTSNTIVTAASLNANVDVITLGFNASDSLVVNSLADFNSNTNIDGILTVTANAAFTGSNTTVTALEATGEVRLKGTSARTVKTQSTNSTLYSLNLSLANTSATITPLIISSTALLPDTTTTYDIGSSSATWNKAWVKDLDVANSVNIQVDAEVDRDMIVRRDLYVFGNTSLSSNATLSLNTSNINDLNVLTTLSFIGGAGFDTDALPTANVSYSLGSNLMRWNQVFANNVTANTAALISFTTDSVGSNLIPSANVSYSVGSNLMRWNQVFANNVTANTVTATTVTAALTGNASTATTLQTARTINGVSFNGSANIVVTANTNNTLTRGTYLTGSNFDGSAATTWAVDATDASTASKVVVRDASRNFAANTITADLVGNASTATTLATARAINGVNFNGSAAITITANTPNTLTRGTYLTGSNFNGGAATTWAVDATTTSTADKVVARDAAQNFAANTITAALAGNASTATTLQTSRTINGVSFNGSANITITANTNQAHTAGNYLTGSNFNGSAAVTWDVDATNLATAGTVVARDASSNFAANTITAVAFSGSGASLTSLNGSNISSGTVADARIATTLVRTSRDIAAGDGLSGGGDLTADRSFAVDSTVIRTTGTQTLSGTKTFPTLRYSGTALPDTTNVYNLGSSTLKFATVFATTFNGTATSAQYADLAENYLADKDYEVGTVMAVGGVAEVTAADGYNAHSVIGVVSEKPAYLMNSDLQGGTAIALKGRVPVKVLGVAKKGDRLAPSMTPGYAEVNNSKDAWSFAIALEDGSLMVEAVIL